MARRSLSKIGVEWDARRAQPQAQRSLNGMFGRGNGTQLSGIDDDEGSDGGCTRRVKLQVNWNLYGSIRVQIMINWNAFHGGTNETRTEEEKKKM